MSVRPILKIVIISAAFTAVPISADAENDGRCGMYPDNVYDSVYATFSDCRLKQAGEKPLWHGVTDKKYRQQIRLAFTHGHFSYTRIINFAELSDGTGTINIRTIYNEYRKPKKISKLRRYKLWKDDVAKINALGDQSGVWKFANGSWDGEEMYLHCQTLDMERINGDGYRFSSVNIGCNHPEKLMPFVDHITKLVELKPSHDGRLY